MDNGFMHQTVGNRAPKGADGCWVDVFEKPFFGGRMERHFDVESVRQLLASGTNFGSLITGPAAELVDKDQKAVVAPGRLIPEPSAHPKIGRAVALRSAKAKSLSPQSRRP